MVECFWCVTALPCMALNGYHHWFGYWATAAVIQNPTASLNPLFQAMPTCLLTNSTVFNLGGYPIEKKKININYGLIV